VINADVRNQSAFQRLPQRPYDYLFHFAAPSSVVLFDEDAKECINITVDGFMNAVKWAIDNNARLVYPSSGSLYSGSPFPHSEDSELQPDVMNPYAKTKRALEMTHLSHGSELDAVGLRIFAGYGPSEKQKQDFASVVTLFAKDILNGNRPLVYGDGEQKRDFVYETDVAKGTLAIGSLAEEDIVNIGSGCPISFNKIIEIINRNVGSDLEPTYEQPPSDYLEKTKAETSRMEKYYTPDVAIEQGVSTVIENLQ
jgi:UDP-glucose 4-epimerase